MSEKTPSPFLQLPAVVGLELDILLPVAEADDLVLVHPGLGLPVQQDGHAVHLAARALDDVGRRRLNVLLAPGHEVEPKVPQDGGRVICPIASFVPGF